MNYYLLSLASVTGAALFMPSDSAWAQASNGGEKDCCYGQQAG